MAKKLKSMPKIDIERDNAYHRVNPKGDLEFVQSAKGKQEETLNELNNEILDLLEWMESELALDSRNKYIANRPSKSIIQNECFTGTSGIAIAPVKYTVIHNDDDEESEDDNPKKSESKMAAENMRKAIDMLLTEWEPSFQAGEYDPGDYQMPSPTGDGVAKKNVKQDKVGSYDTDTSKVGEPFPGKHNDTVAMCDVDDDGVENKPQGSHESSHAEADDGHQTKLGHDWPAKAKNSGGGVAEPFGGKRWSDGGTLDGGKGQDELTIKKGGPGIPKEGPITGTDGPQNGQMEWSPEKIGSLLGEDIDLQALFDSYARSTDQIHLEGLQDLCIAHGADVLLDNRSLLNLMDANQEYMFYEQRDAYGPYWLKQAVNEGENPFADADDDEECEEGDEDCPFENRQSKKTPINEFQDNRRGVGRSPALGRGSAGPGPAGPARPGAAGPAMGVGPAMGAGVPAAPAPAPAMGATGGGMGGMDAGMGDGDDFMSYGDMETMEPTDQDLLSVDQLGMGGAGDMGMGGDEYMDDIPMGQPDMVGQSEMGAGEFQHQLTDRHRAGGIPEGRTIVSGPKLVESIAKFMTSAKAMIENGQRTGTNVAESLNDAWFFHAGNVDPNNVPTNVKVTLKKLMNSFPGFNPTLQESGKGLSADAPKNSPFLAKQPSEMTEHGQKNLFTHKTKNDISNPGVKGTEKKASSEHKLVGRNADILRENVSKLSRRIKNAIAESAKGLRGKYSVNFSIVVTENHAKNRTPIRKQLVEALADLEEVLQLHDVEDVTFETRFKDLSGAVVLKTDVPLLTINPRGPIVAEGKALFRFQKNAELFVECLVSAGHTCKINAHPWGSSVASRVNLETANRAFKVLTERAHS